jgi:hypothetical protein
MKARGKSLDSGISCPRIQATEPDKIEQSKMLPHGADAWIRPEERPNVPSATFSLSAAKLFEIKG